MTKTQWLWLVMAMGWILGAGTARADVNDLATRIRRPTALELSADEAQLFVANARSGSISVIALAQNQVVREADVGQRLSDLRLMPDGKTLLVTDESSHQLLVVDASGESFSVLHRIPVAPYPVSVSIAADGSWAVVASLWSRQLTFVEWPSGARQDATVTSLVDLPFSPRCQVLVQNDERLIVADAFGSKMGVVDTQGRKLMHVRSFPSHNIRGLGVNPSGKMLLVVHQMLNELAHTTNNDVHWGLLMSNDLRWLPLTSVLSPDADLYRGAHMHPLGSAGNATGDPSGLAVTQDGRVVVSLGGVGEIAIGTETDFSLQRIPVGRRPTAIITDRAGRLAYVANTFSDSISIVDLNQRAADRQISLGPASELTLADRGELLFYDASLSHDSWMSCHSCHTDGHSNSLLNDNFSDDSFGAPKRVLSLLGVTDTAPFAWSGRVSTLEEQIETSIVNTMQGDEKPTERQIAALAAFVRSLPVPPPLDVARGRRDAEAIGRGEKLFGTLQCNRCHAQPTYTTPGRYDVGIHDKYDNKEFNPPSLRSVSQRGPYFHDNRAETLEAVFREQGHQLDRTLSDGELQDLVSFLRSL